MFFVVKELSAENVTENRIQVDGENAIEKCYSCILCESSSMSIRALKTHKKRAHEL